MGRLVDTGQSIITPNETTTKLAMNYIVECYPNKPDEMHETLHKFTVDDRRSLIAILFQEMNELMWAGALKGGISTPGEIDTS